jgi:selenocysteine lyase/cysteine desulfurase
VRGDFPAATASLYFNTPYIGPPPRQVEEAGVAFVRQKSLDPILLGSMLEKTDEVRGDFAKLFGAKPNEVAFLFATSEGENLVARALGLGEGDNVVVDDLHYTTSYVLYKTLEKEKGIEVRVVRSEEGRADPGHFEPLVDKRTRLVSVSWVSHQNGFRHDLKGLSQLAHANGALLYADGVQGLGMLDTNLRDEGVDFMTSGTYKWLYASYGVAPFYLREEHLDRVAPDRLGALSVSSEKPDYEFELFDTAKKYEYATLAFGPVYQLGAALTYLSGVGLGEIEAHTVGLARELHTELESMGFRMRTPKENGSAIVAFAHGKDPEQVEPVLERRNVRVSLREEGTEIRAGVALFNTRSDVEQLLDAAKEIAEL